MYVQRDGDGDIVGAFNRPQGLPGSFTTEPLRLSDDDPELLSFLNPPPTKDQLREAEYRKQGVTEQAMIIALWERTIEGRSDTSDALQIKRVQIKIDIP